MSILDKSAGGTEVDNSAMMSASEWRLMNLNAAQDGQGSMNRIQ